MAIVPNSTTSGSDPQPAWEVALLFPSQGDWSENDYLALDTKRLVELIDGRLDVLPMPTFLHQDIVLHLADVLRAFVRGRRLGKVTIAPMPVHIRHKTFREPDVLFVPIEQQVKATDNFVQSAGIVIEIVSPGPESHKRDYQDKRADYAQLKIPEYWIVDPQTERITVLILKGKQYRIHGEFVPGQQATSVFLDGLEVDVSAVFNAGKKLP